VLRSASSWKAACVIAAYAFVAVAVLLCGLACLAILRIADVALSGSSGIERHGLHRGVRAPRWSLPDSSGVTLSSPPTKPLQLIVFADHSLKSFPSAVEGLTDLIRTAPRSALEIVVLLRGENRLAEPVLRLLGVTDVSVVTGSASLYARYNVRVMPWVMFIDSSGIVRASSLVTEAWQIERLRRLAGVPLGSYAVPSRRAARDNALAEV
jgi:hypothetical protein